MKVQTTLMRGTLAKTAIVLACVVALAGCKTVAGWFGADPAKHANDPAELTDITPTVKVQKMWSAEIKDAGGKAIAFQ